MPEPIIIGIGHKARHGKDTLASHIIDEYSHRYDIRKYPFAAALKAEVNSIDQFEACFKQGIPYDFQPDMTDPLCNTKHGKQAALLQFWGEFKRKEDPFYWIKKLHKQLEEEKPQFALVTDMRYLNEFLYIKSRKGYTIKCTRKGYVDLTRDPNHISETELNNRVFDFDVSVAEGEVDGLLIAARDVFDLIIDDLTPKIGCEGDTLVVQSS